MMGIVNGIIDDATKAFGSGGRLYSDAKPSESAPARPAVKSDEAAPAVVRVAKNWDLRAIGSTMLELAGICGVSFGAYQIYPPAGWITAGVALTVLGVAMGVDR